MSSRKTIAQRVQALEDWMLIAQDQPVEALTPLEPSDYDEAQRKLQLLISADRDINAHRILTMIEKELQNEQISTLRVRNLAIAYSALRNS